MVIRQKLALCILSGCTKSISNTVTFKMEVCGLQEDHLKLLSPTETLLYFCNFYYVQLITEMIYLCQMSIFT